MYNTIQAIWENYDSTHYIYTYNVSESAETYIVYCWNILYLTSNQSHFNLMFKHLDLCLTQLTLPAYVFPLPDILLQFNAPIIFAKFQLICTLNICVLTYGCPPPYSQRWPQCVTDSRDGPCLVQLSPSSKVSIQQAHSCCYNTSSDPCHLKGGTKMEILSLASLNGYMIYVDHSFANRTSCPDFNSSFILIPICWQ